MSTYHLSCGRAERQNPTAAQGREASSRHFGYSLTSTACYPSIHHGCVIALVGANVLLTLVYRAHKNSRSFCKVTLNMTGVMAT